MFKLGTWKGYTVYETTKEEFANSSLCTDYAFLIDDDLIIYGNDGRWYKVAKCDGSTVEEHEWEVYKRLKKEKEKKKPKVSVRPFEDNTKSHRHEVEDCPVDGKTEEVSLEDIKELTTYVDEFLEKAKGECVYERVLFREELG